MGLCFNITYSECDKRRVIYAAKRLDQIQRKALEAVKDEQVYSCGSALFHEGPYTDVIVVREGMNCQSTIETTYYAGTGLKA